MTFAPKIGHSPSQNWRLHPKIGIHPPQKIGICIKISGHSRALPTPTVQPPPLPAHTPYPPSGGGAKRNLKEGCHGVQRLRRPHRGEVLRQLAQAAVQRRHRGLLRTHGTPGVVFKLPRVGLESNVCSCKESEILLHFLRLNNFTMEWNSQMG